MLGNVNDQMEIPTIPSEIFRLAFNNFDPNNFYLKIGSNLEKITRGINLELLRLKNKPFLSLSTLPLITLFQNLEKLTDMTAIDALQYRIEWKFALHLPMVPPVMEETILCDFRGYLFDNDQRLKEYQKLIDRIMVLIPQEMSDYIFVEQMVRDVCEFNQKAAAVSVLYNALSILKLNHPKWLKKHDKPSLYARYLPLTSQYDVLIPHDFPQYHIDDVLNDFAYLLREITLFGSVEIKNLNEIMNLSQIADQIRKNKAGKRAASDCKDFISVANRKR